LRLYKGSLLSQNLGAVQKVQFSTVIASVSEAIYFETP